MAPGPRRPPLPTAPLLILSPAPLSHLSVASSSACSLSTTHPDVHNWLCNVTIIIGEWGTIIDHDGRLQLLIEYFFTFVRPSPVSALSLHPPSPSKYQHQYYHLTINLYSHIFISADVVTIMCIGQSSLGLLQGRVGYWLLGGKWQGGRQCSCRLSGASSREHVIDGAGQQQNIKGWNETKMEAR